MMMRSRICARSGLLYCMEYLEESLDDWLGEELQVVSSFAAQPAQRNHSTLGQPCADG